ncbi:MAG TPA: phage tail protein [Caulobacteraceae bacterium]|jgi:hypothetical protein
MAKIAIAIGLAILIVVAPPIGAAAFGVGGSFAAGLAAVGPAFGAFIGAGAAGIGGAIAAWGTVALFAASALISAPKVGRGAAGSQVNFQADPSAGFPLMLGRSATAGKIIHANTDGQGDKNKALYYLVALTGGPLGNFEKLIATDQDCTFDGSGRCTAPGTWAGKMFLNVTPGNKPDAVAYYPAGISQSQCPEWTAANKLSGIACAWWTMLYDTTAYAGGVPQPLFVIRGPSVYDPRADSTYPGGSGPQRWNDVTTWSQTGTDNPFLQGLAWCIGRFDNGKLTHGIGATIDTIDVAAFVEGANVCDYNNWTIGGEVLSSDKKWDVLTSILQAGGGEPIQLGGLISAFVRTPKVILATLTGADTVGNISITGTKRRRDRLNQIIPTYRSEANNWQLVPAGAVTVNEYIGPDGGLRSKEGSYPLVQDPAQVAQLAAYDILDAREFEPIVLPLGPRWQGVAPGDCIQITEDEFGMGEGQPVIIETRQLDLAAGTVTLTCRSETAGKHDYALGRTPNPPPIPGLQPSDPTYVAAPDPGSWTAWGGVLQGADGSQVPAIVVTGAVNDPNINGVIIEYALELGTGPPTFGDWVSDMFPATIRRAEFRAVISGATYHVQVRYRSVRDVEGHLVLDLGLVTVGSSISQGVADIGGQTPEELLQQLEDTTTLAQNASDQAAQTASDLVFTNQNLHDATTLPDGTDLETYTVNNVTSLTNSSTYSTTRLDAIGIMRPDGKTFQLSDTTLYADPTNTWGNYKQSLQVSIGNNTSAITTEQTTRANADSALSTQITNVSSTVSGNTASINNLQTSVNGLNAQWVLSVSSSGPGYQQVAGIKLAANPTTSSIAFVASQIGFTDGTTPIFPLAIVGGKVIATNFQADDIKANTITTNKIVANNISVASRIPWSGSLSPSGTAPGPQIMSSVFNCSGGYIDIDLWFNATTSSNLEIDLVYTLFIDGAQIDTFGCACHSLNYGSSYNEATYSYKHKPAAGNHTYSVNVSQITYTGSGSALIKRGTMTILDNKTQS